MPRQSNANWQNGITPLGLFLVASDRRGIARDGGRSLVIVHGQKWMIIPLPFPLPFPRSLCDQFRLI
jgi:hypothetical protein